MQYRLVLVTALAGSTSALPNFLRSRQAVPQGIAPPEPIPSGYADTLPGTFGIAVMNVTTNGAAQTGTEEPLTQIDEYVHLLSATSSF